MLFRMAPIASHIRACGLRIECSIHGAAAAGGAAGAVAELGDAASPPVPPPELGDTCCRDRARNARSWCRCMSKPTSPDVGVVAAAGLAAVATVAGAAAAVVVAAATAVLLVATLPVMMGVGDTRGGATEMGLAAGTMGVAAMRATSASSRAAATAAAADGAMACGAANDRDRAHIE